MKEIIYVGELDQDIDDYLAIAYLQEIGYLSYVVLNPLPKAEGIDRKRKLEQIGVVFEDSLTGDIETVVVGGALTPIKEWHEMNPDKKIKNLVIQGGYVGRNIYSYFHKEPLNKFKKDEQVRTFNLNLDVTSAKYVLGQECKNSIENIHMIGKNVCHSRHNTKKELWSHFVPNDAKFFSNEMKLVSINKRLHDLLAATEAVRLVNGTESQLDYVEVFPTVIRAKDDKMSRWGSSFRQIGGFRKVNAAIGYKAYDNLN